MLPITATSWHWFYRVLMMNQRSACIFCWRYLVSRCYLVSWWQLGNAFNLWIIIDLNWCSNTCIFFWKSVYPRSAVMFFLSCENPSISNVSHANLPWLDSKWASLWLRHYSSRSFMLSRQSGGFKIPWNISIRNLTLCLKLFWRDCPRSLTLCRILLTISHLSICIYVCDVATLV